MSRAQIAALGQRGVWVPLWLLDELGAGTPAVFFAQLLFLTRGDLDSTVVRADSEWSSDTGLSTDQAYRARKKLEELGWLSTDVHQRGGAPVPHLRVAWSNLEDRLRAIAESDSAQSRRDLRESAECSSLSAIENKPPCSPPDGGTLDLIVAVVDRFDDFWKAYPRRIGKGAARRAWKTALKKTEPDLLVDSAAAFASMRAGDDPNFIPHPSTWLNGERWNDEPETVHESEPRGFAALRSHA